MKVTTTGARGRVIELEEIPLDEFIDDYFAPEPGQHVVLIGPTGSGKTTIGMRLLAKYAELHRSLTAVALVMKPHKGPKSRGRRSTGDPTVEKAIVKYGGRITRTWPPPKLLPWQKRPLFWALWPKHTGDPAEDKFQHRVVMRKCLIASYRDGDSIVFADEAAGLAEELDLDEELTQTDTRGRSMNNGKISGSQRPRYVPRSTFTEGRHFFLHRMSDEGEYERVREIGGGQLNRAEIVAVLGKLRRHQWLYLYPEKDIACVLV